MAFGYEPEIRVAGAVVTQVAILAGGWRFVSRRRFGVGAERSALDGWMGRWSDVLLIDFLVMYAAVGVTGMLGVLNTVSVLGGFGCDGVRAWVGWARRARGGGAAIAVGALGYSGGDGVFGGLFAAVRFLQDDGGGADQ